MMHAPSTQKALRFLNQNRRRKKIALYKQALRVMIDKTITIYLLIVGGYFLASFFIANDFIANHIDFFLQIENQAKMNFWLFLTILPIRYVLQSFSKPGVLITTSEYQLSLLPYDRLKIWVSIAVKGIVKLTIIALLIGIFLAVLLPISTSLIFAYIIILISIELLMRIPQWKLFQKSFLFKTAILLFVFLINGIHFWIQFTFDTSIVGFIFVSGLLVSNIVLNKRLFKQVQWNKVTEANDFIVWNLWLISRASKTEMKRRRTYNVFQKLAYRKKPLHYNERALHRRLWQIYFGKNAVLVFQLLGILLLILIVTQFVHQHVFYIGVALMLHIYTAMTASFYQDRFKADIVQILPWNLLKYKRTLLRWAWGGAIILFIPVIGYLLRNSGMWMPIQLIFLISTLNYLFHVKIKKSMILLSKQTVHTQIEEGFGTICLIAVWYSGMQPMISLLMIPLIWFVIRYRNLAHSTI